MIGQPAWSGREGSVGITVDSDPDHGESAVSSCRHLQGGRGAGRTGAECLHGRSPRRAPADHNEIGRHGQLPATGVAPKRGRSRRSARALPAGTTSSTAAGSLPSGGGHPGQSFWILQPREREFRRLALGRAGPRRHRRGATPDRRHAGARPHSLAWRRTPRTWTAAVRGCLVRLHPRRGSRPSSERDTRPDASSSTSRRSWRGEQPHRASRIGWPAFVMRRVPDARRGTAASTGAAGCGGERCSIRGRLRGRLPVRRCRRSGRDSGGRRRQGRCRPCRRG